MGYADARRLWPARRVQRRGFELYAEGPKRAQEPLARRAQG